MSYLPVIGFVICLIAFIAVCLWPKHDRKKLPEQSEKYGKCPETCPFLLKGSPCFCARYDTAMWTVTTHTVGCGPLPGQECYAPRECDIAREANLK